ncbi:hypothetical protein FLAG1_06640 [Fusarium langsethiae]|uniref:Uncharacterized protein n=1 Tax=Fusarium langsethiae TaxID=179993 RepID=A0A0N0DE19_FUSLA|nr:hypothetical protein FLAG1_06640 [Fusarium langsethiae]GKU02777.1 unnamed protein product [Fusarium langsethiae]GKU18290.1 unnamed protein product [Fusarium langsethiae]
MTVANTSPEVVVAIVFGILQLIVGLVALWQQHYLRWTNYSENDETPFEYIEMHTLEDPKNSKQYTQPTFWCEIEWNDQSS